MQINFEYKKCNEIFVFEAEKRKMNEQTFRPNFKKEITRPKCAVLTIDEVFLTILGQSQMTEVMMNI